MFLKKNDETLLYDLLGISPEDLEWIQNQVYQKLYPFANEQTPRMPQLDILVYSFTSDKTSCPAFCSNEPKFKHAKIHLNLQYINQMLSSKSIYETKYEVLGVLAHETVHAIQGDQQLEWFMIEGIADYIRYEIGFPARHWSKFDFKQRYKLESGYQETAFFLKSIEHHLKSQIVWKINQEVLLRPWHWYKLKEFTGKSLEEWKFLIS